MTLKRLSAALAKRQLLLRKAIWRLLVKPTDKTTLFVLGVQRSGTTAMMACIDKMLDCQVFGETDPAAMQDCNILGLPTLHRLVRESGHSVVAFKPLKESHRAHEFLSFPNARVIWSYRTVENVVASNVKRFGDDNLQLLRRRAEGLWITDGLSRASLDYLDSLDYETMTPHTACAVLWYVRNLMYFDLGLNGRDDVMPVAYEDFAANPSLVLRRVCDFVGMDFNPAIARGIHARSLKTAKVDLPEDLIRKCRALYDQIQASELVAVPAMGYAT